MPVPALHKVWPCQLLPWGPCMQMTRLRCFMYVSTAFSSSHCARGSVVTEQLHPLVGSGGQPADPAGIVRHLMQTPPDQAQAEVWVQALRWHLLVMSKQLSVRSIALGRSDSVLRHSAVLDQSGQRAQLSSLLYMADQGACVEIPLPWTRHNCSSAGHNAACHAAAGREAVQGIWLPTHELCLCQKSDRGAGCELPWQALPSLHQPAGLSGLHCAQPRGRLCGQHLWCHRHHPQLGMW